MTEILLDVTSSMMREVAAEVIQKARNRGTVGLGGKGRGNCEFYYNVNCKLESSFFFFIKII